MKLHEIYGINYLNNRLSYKFEFIVHVSSYNMYFSKEYINFVAHRTLLYICIFTQVISHRK